MTNPGNWRVKTYFLRNTLGAAQRLTGVYLRLNERATPLPDLPPVGVALDGEGADIPPEYRPASATQGILPALYVPLNDLHVPNNGVLHVFVTLPDEFITELTEGEFAYYASVTRDVTGQPELSDGGTYLEGTGWNFQYYDDDRMRWQPTASIEVVSERDDTTRRELLPEHLTGWNDAPVDGVPVRTYTGVEWRAPASTEFGSVLDMNALGLRDGQTVHVQQHTPGTGLGGGVFVWRVGSDANPDGGGVIMPADGAQGRFLRVSHLLGRYTPEDFGAIGDDVHDDYPAFMLLCAAVNRVRGGQVDFRKDARYYYGQYVDSRRAPGEGPSDEWRDIPFFRMFTKLLVNMNGATISGYRGGHRPQGNFMFKDSVNTEWWNSPVAGISGLTFAYGDNLEVRDGYLDGQSRTWTRWEEPPTSIREDGYPIGAKHLNESYCQGIQLWAVNKYTITNVHARDWMTDGFQVNTSEVYDATGQRVTNEDRIICYDGMITNCSSLNNRRQGISVIGARRLTVINSDFSETGFASFDEATLTGTKDAYGWHEPGLGVDVEPFSWPTYWADPTWRVMDTTGDVSFINCKIAHNINGVLGATYSQKINGGVVFQNCRLDGRGEAFPDSWIMVGAGVTIRDCTIYLPKNGFLFCDIGKMTERVLDDMYVKVLDNNIFVTSTLGYYQADKPLMLDIRGNTLHLPETVNPDSPPIGFLDRHAFTQALGIGQTKSIKFSNNHILIPYSLPASDPVNGVTIAMLEGLGHVSDNVWELTGERPSGLGQWWNAMILYSTAIAGGGKRYDTKPASERFILPPTSPATDFAQDTPSGFKSLALYTYQEPKTDYIPFGLSGEVPAGETTIITAMIPETAIRLTGITTHLDSSPPAGVTMKVSIRKDGVEVASATFAAGEFIPTALTGFPVMMYRLNALSIVFSFDRGATSAKPTNLVGAVAYQVIEE